MFATDLKFVIVVSMWIVLSPLTLPRLEKILLQPENVSYLYFTNTEFYGRLTGRALTQKNVYCENSWEKREFKGCLTKLACTQAHSENNSMLLHQNIYQTHRRMGFAWIVQDVDQDSEDEKELHVLSAQQRNFDSNELGGSRTNAKWCITQIAKQYYTDNCGKIRCVFTDSWLRVKGFCGRIFRQLSKACDI